MTHSTHEIPQLASAAPGMMSPAAVLPTPAIQRWSRWERAWRLISRFALPGFVVRILYFVRFRAMLGPQSEVEWSRLADWGPGCVISSFAKVKINGSFRLGADVHVGPGCFIEVSDGGLDIGENVLIGPNCSILTSTYVYSRLDIPIQDQGHLSKGVRIGHNVWIGANSVILDGAVVGDNVIVSAGSVVSGRIGPNSIVQGNPARVVFTRR